MDLAGWKPSHNVGRFVIFPSRLSPGWSITGAGTGTGALQATDNDSRRVPLLGTAFGRRMPASVSAGAHDKGHLLRQVSRLEPPRARLSYLASNCERVKAPVMASLNPSD